MLKALSLVLSVFVLTCKAKPLREHVRGTQQQKSNSGGDGATSVTWSSVDGGQSICNPNTPPGTVIEITATSQDSCLAACSSLILPSRQGELVALSYNSGTKQCICHKECECLEYGDDESNWSVGFEAGTSLPQQEIQPGFAVNRYCLDDPSTCKSKAATDCVSRCSPCMENPEGKDAQGGECASCVGPCNKYLPCATSSSNSRANCGTAAGVACVARCSSCLACYENDNTNCKDAAGDTCDTCTDCAEYLPCVDSPEFEGYKYIFDGAGQTFQDAQKSCEDLGGGIAWLESAAEERFIKEKVMQGSHRSVWISCSDAAKEGEWLWPDGSSCTLGDAGYTDWRDGQPNSWRGQDQDCAALIWDIPQIGLHDGGGQWFDLGCDWDAPGSICKIAVPQDPVNRLRPTNTATKFGYKYEYYDSPLTSAQQAADYCERRGGRGRGGRRTDGAGLAWITSPTEEAFIKSTVMNGDTQTNVWIDGADIDTEGKWMRKDGVEINRKSLGYSNWATGQPGSNGGSNEDCAAMIFVIPKIVSDPTGKWHDVSCDLDGDAWAGDGFGFICKIPDGQTPPAVRGPASIAGLDTFTYQYYMLPQSWQLANQNCVQQGGTLADFASEAEEDFVKTTVMAGSTQPVWIGCNDVNSEGTWQWADHTTCDPNAGGGSRVYTNWAPGEPNQYQGSNEDCAVTRRDTGQWNDVPCLLHAFGSVCKIPDGPPADQGNTEELDGYRYTYYATATTSWTTAQTTCRRRGGDLVQITSDDEEAFIKAKVLQGGKQMVWTGCTDSAAEGKWMWGDGTSCLPEDDGHYSNWHDGEPNSWPDGKGNEDCTVLLWNTYDFEGDGQWFDVPCDLNGDDAPKQTKGIGAGFICKTLVASPEPVVRGDYTYQYLTQHSDGWQDSREQCKALGGDLAWYTTEEEETFIHETVMGDRHIPTWIGCNDIAKEGEWVWPDGSSCAPGGSAAYANWADGQPNSFRGTDQDCAMMAFVHWRSTAIDDKGKWDDQDCNVKDNAAVCKTLTKAPPPKPVVRGDFQYQFVSDPKEAQSWEAANAVCDGLGGYLAEILDADENEFIATTVLAGMSTAQSARVWIGANDLETEGTWAWAHSGAELQFADWRPNEPNNRRNEDCAAISSVAYKSQWNDLPCDIKAQFVCKIPLPSAGLPACPASCQPAFDACGTSAGGDAQCLTFCANGYLCKDAGGGGVKCNGIGLVDQSKHHIMCPGGKEYTPCLAAQQPTCWDPKPAGPGKTCTPGCACPSGTPLWDPVARQCVEYRDCPGIQSDCGPIPVNYLGLGAVAVESKASCTSPDGSCSPDCAGGTCLAKPTYPDQEGYASLCKTLAQGDCGKKGGASWFSHRCTWAPSGQAHGPVFGCSAGRWVVEDAGTCPGGGGYREAVCQTMELEQCWSSPDCTDADMQGKCAKMVAVAETLGTCKFPCKNVKGGRKDDLAKCNACINKQFGANPAFLRNLADCCGCMVPTLAASPLFLPVDVQQRVLALPCKLHDPVSDDDSQDDDVVIG